MKNLFSQLFLATVALFEGPIDMPSEPDKHGKMPVILNLVAGLCPDKRVIAGTVAERAGLIVGQCHLIQVTERPPTDDEIADGYGRQFNFTVVKADLGFSEILQGQKEFGPARLVVVTEGAEDTSEEDAKVQAKADKKAAKKAAKKLAKKTALKVK